MRCRVWFCVKLSLRLSVVVYVVSGCVCNAFVVLCAFKCMNVDA